MNDIQVGRYSQLLHKLLEISEGSPTPTIAPELFAMLTLEVDRPEWGWLKGEYPCAGYANEGAGAGARSIVALLNPTGSNALIVVEGAEILHSPELVLMEQVFGTSLTGFDDDGIERVIDLRAGTSGLGYWRNPVGKIMTDTRAVLSATFGHLLPITTTSTPTNVFRLEHPVILPPNSALAFTGSQDNVALRATIYWRERAIEPMELQGVNPRLR